MPENPNNAVPISSNSPPSATPADDELQETMWKLSVQEKEEKEGDADANLTKPVPDHTRIPDCIHYLRTGKCGYGSNCRYNHPSHGGQGPLYRDDLPERVGQPDCQHFLKTGTCKFGHTCKYHHPKNRHDDGQISLNVLGLPMRQGEKSCPYYMRTGFCKFGIACKFNHPQPAPAPFGAVLPVPGSTAYAPVGSSMISPTGVPLIGGLTSLSLPRQPYMSSPQMNGLPAYTPVLPSSQGLLPGQHGWSTYTGTISPVSSTDALGHNQMSNSNSHIQFGSSTQVLFPERPDQPECQYYMKNGSCKYGPSCKYHHPRERVTSSTTCTIGPLGLPLRPGQAVCTFYSTYGNCKYGLGCKFDHPPAGYYNYSLPAVPVMDPSVLFPRQRGTQVTLAAADAAPSKTLKLPDSLAKSEATSNNVESVVSSLSEDGPPQASSTQTTPSETLQDQSSD